MSALNEALHSALLTASASLLDEEPLDMRDPSPEEGRSPLDRMLAEERRAAETEDELDAGVPLPCDDMLERAKYIPLRLSYEERKVLRLVMAAVNVSDYTSVVDVDFRSRTRRRHTQLQVLSLPRETLITVSTAHRGLPHRTCLLG